MQRPISDDDVCSGCTQCTYRPGEMSGCALDWPATFDADGYAPKCSDLMPIKHWGENIPAECLEGDTLPPGLVD